MEVPKDYMFFLKHYLRKVNVSHYINQFMVFFVTPTAELYAKYRFPFMVSEHNILCVMSQQMLNSYTIQFSCSGT